MKKQLKYIIITLCAAVVLGLAAFAASVLIPDSQTGDGESSKLSQTVKIYDKEDTSAVMFTVTNQYGVYELKRKDSGNFYIEDLEGFNVSQTYLNSFANTFSSVTAKKLVTEQPEDLSLYGLDEPEASVKAEFSDETLTLLIGDTEATTNGYYCKLENSDRIYLISAGIGGRLFSSKLYYIDRQITPAYDTNKELVIENLTLSGAVREEDIVIVPTEETDDEYAQIFGYNIIAPANAPLDLTKGTDFLTSFFVLTGDTTVAISPDEETLAEYGFDSPYSVAKVKSSAGNFTVTVGKVDGEYCYVMNDTDDVIFRCQKSSVSWLETQYYELVSSIFLVPHINTVDKVEINTPGEDFVFDIDYDKQSDVYTVKRDGKTLNSSNFQSFYQVLVSAYLENYSEERCDDAPKLTLTYRYINGGKDTVEFITSPTDPRSCIIKLNGNYTDFTVRAVYVDKVISDCQKVLTGEEIATTW